MLEFISSQVENQPEIFGPLHFIVLGVFCSIVNFNMRIFEKD